MKKPFIAGMIKRCIRLYQVQEDH